MGLSAALVKHVRLAFKIIGDLAIDVTLTQKDSQSFDFGTRTATISTPVATVIKAVKGTTDRDTSSNEANTIKETLYISAEDADDLTVCDKATFDGFTWNIVQPIENNGYTIKMTVSRVA